MNLNNPAVTVIICMYKGEATVSRMIDCVLNQTLGDFELILVDDGSPDSCGEIADNYAQKDERVRVLHKPNGGLADARNKALEIAKGEYTIQFDQDDWVELNCLEGMYAKAKGEDSDMLICDYYHNDEYRQSYAKQAPTALDHWSVLEDVVTGRLYGYCWNKLIKLEVYKKYGIKFPTEFYGCEDQFGMCQMLKHDIKIYYLPKAFCHYVYVQGSLSRHYDEKTFKNDLLVRDMFVELLQDTASVKSVNTCKSSAIFTRAFLFGKHQYSSSEFKKSFSEFYPYVSKKGLEGFLYSMANQGHYQFARSVYTLLFQFKQLLKKLRYS
jgi:glycosyltransferase involved in cell wall biosynthesis